MRVAPWSCVSVLVASCGASQSTPTVASHPAADAGPPAVVDAAQATPPPNPCAGNRPPARLPDGGVNPEACIGVCTHIPHDPATAAPGDPIGTIDLPSVDRTLRREAITLRECYDSAVTAHPWLANQTATITVEFIVEPNGHVRPMPLATGLPDAPSVATCLTMRLRHITFPLPTGGPADVTLPFTFGGS